jgi:hypothetical protein
LAEANLEGLREQLQQYMLAGAKVATAGNWQLSRFRDVERAALFSVARQHNPRLRANTEGSLNISIRQ